MFRVEVRGANPTNGHTGEPPVSCVEVVEAETWELSRVFVARRLGIEVYDSAMSSTEIDPATLKTPRRRTKGAP